MEFILLYNENDLPNQYSFQYHPLINNKLPINFTKQIQNPAIFLPVKFFYYTSLYFKKILASMIYYIHKAILNYSIFRNLLRSTNGKYFCVRYSRTKKLLQEKDFPLKVQLALNRYFHSHSNLSLRLIYTQISTNTMVKQVSSWFKNFKRISIPI